MFFIVYLVTKVRSSCAFGYRFVNFDFRDSGIFINASGAILGIGVLIYVYVRCPETTEVKRSTILALGYLLLFLALCINVLIRLSIPQGVTTHNLNTLARIYHSSR